MNYRRGTWTLALLFFLVALGQRVEAGTYRIQSRAAWKTWSLPGEAVVLGNDGSVRPRRYRRNINAAANASEFEYLTKDDGLVFGGVRRVGSGQATAARVIDSDITTWWQPSPSDELEDMWLEVDLGRTVIANRIRLVFPDTSGARPFRNFTLYTSEGARTSLKNDVFLFTRIGSTIEPNTETVIDYDLSIIDPAGATGAYLVTGDTLSFNVVQYIRFVVDKAQADAALAEIEVWTPGENIALGTLNRGGNIVSGTDTEGVASVMDGDMNEWWSVTAERDAAGDWEFSGAWYEWDLGATFWLDRHVALSFREGFGTSGGGSNRQHGFIMFTSDGEELTGFSGDRVESNFDYQELTEVDNILVPPPRYIYDFHFPMRPVRYVFYHVVNKFHANGHPYNHFIRLWEHLWFGGGYPAAVEMTSDYIDLGATKSITSIEWDLDAPPEASIELRSRTGDNFIIESKYYNKAGVEIPVALWNKLPKSQKQPVVEIRRPGSDWSTWSRTYLRSGQPFLSPSPRSFVQLQVRLLSDTPDTAAILRSIAINFDDPLLRGGVTGRILPREAALDSLQRFDYLIKPGIGSGTGFNQVLILVPRPVEDVTLRIGENDAEPTAVEMLGDSLSVTLPASNRRDSVTISFDTRLIEAATRFDAWVRNSNTGVLQGVREEDTGLTSVYVPAAARGSLIRNLDLSSNIVTPNGDGVNDQLEIRFVLTKVRTEPDIEIFSLSGQLVRVVEAADGVHSWEGRDQAGQLVPPGAYICQLRVSADAGDEVLHRIIDVAY